jgi:hypothetical protein
MIFVGPTLKSGIGQHTFKYTKLFPDAQYFEFGQEIPECEHAFMFVIPLPSKHNIQGCARPHST